MKFFFDFFPIFVFFISYKVFGIYYATAIAIAASFLQVIIHRLLHGHFEKMHLLSLGLISVLGGATLFFHNPWFIKWKPTGIYWMTALIFVGSNFIGNRPIIQKMMEANINLPPQIWYRLNYIWALFFVVMGAMNLYVAFYYSTDTWVNFKLFGGAGFTLTFIIMQAIYLTRHVIEKEVKQPSNQSS
ncbi:MAG: septation protein A [Proteobacteria bacterium]|nr:septation protein A [Pseudomonadota bacterium]